LYFIIRLNCYNLDIDKERYNKFMEKLKRVEVIHDRLFDELVNDAEDILKEYSK